MTWKPRDAGQRARGGADLGREVGEGGEVVAEQGGGVGELAAGDLHAVAGVAAEADDRALSGFPACGLDWGFSSGHKGLIDLAFRRQ